MVKVFLSHSSADQPLATEFRKHLEVHPTVEVFMASSSIPLGSNWQDQLTRALAKADALVALVSVDWVNSSWCKMEYDQADERGIRVIPIHLKPCPFHLLPIARKYKGIAAAGGKALNELPKNKHPRAMADMAAAIAGALSACAAAIPNTAAARLEYVVPSASDTRKALIVYHCGDRTKGQPPGRQLQDCLVDLFGASGLSVSTHDVTRQSGVPNFEPYQTVFVVDSPTANPIARDVLLNYQRYMVGRKIRHATTLDRGLQIQEIWVDGRGYHSNRHQVLFDTRYSDEGFDDYLVTMRLPGIVLDGDFGETAARRVVWLVYGTTYRGSSAGAQLFSPEIFHDFANWLSNGRHPMPPAFQAVFRIPQIPERVTRWSEIALEPTQSPELLTSLHDKVRGDPVPARLGEEWIRATETDDFSKISLHSVHLDLVAGCNYNCSGCIEKRAKRQNCQLSLRTALTILEDLHTLQCRELSFYGGEPTLHPDFIRIVRQAVGMGFRPFVVTNGSQLVHDRVSAGLASLGDGVRLRASIDANQQGTYARHHGLTGSQYQFTAIRDSIRALAESIAVGVSFLVTPDNVDDLASAIAYWQETKVQNFNLRLPMGNHGCWPSADDAVSELLRTQLRSLLKKNHDPNWLVTPDWLLDWVWDNEPPNLNWAFSRCYSAFYRISISPKGDTYQGPAIPSETFTDTDSAWISLCPYHRYESWCGDAYPANIKDWWKKRGDIVRRIFVDKCHKNNVVCSRVPHNTTVQAEVNRLYNPLRLVPTPSTAG